MTNVRAIPEGLTAVTPQLTLKNCGDAIAFYARAFGAVETQRAMDPSGNNIWHAEINIDGATIFCNDEFPEMGAHAEPATLYVYGDDVDGRFKRAVDAGATVKMPLADMFWGDRSGMVVDAWGVKWMLSQRVKHMTPAEMKAAGDAMVAAMAKK